MCVHHEHRRSNKRKPLKEPAFVFVGITPPQISLSPPGVKDGSGVVPGDLTLNYTPAVHHARPVQWLRLSVPAVPDQFADADE